MFPSTEMIGIRERLLGIMIMTKETLFKREQEFLVDRTYHCTAVIVPRTIHCLVAEQIHWLVIRTILRKDF